MEKTDNANKSKFSLRYLRKIFLFVVGASLVFALGYFLGLRNFYINLYGYPDVHIEREVPQSKKELDFNLFWTVWDKINEK